MSAVDAWLAAAAAGAGPVQAARSAAEACGPDPWQVVEQAGALARARMAVGRDEVGLTETLRVVGAGSRRARWRVPAGAPYPVFDTAGRRRRGAFDTPKALARRLVDRALAAGPFPRQALDPACGTGALLVALAERGVDQLVGLDLDPAALAVAGVALPGAELLVQDGLAGTQGAELVVSNPPFVPRERQSKALRERLRRRFPWLSGRYGLSVPFAASAGERVAPGGVLALLLPAPLLTQPYGEQLRRRWLQAHRVLAVGPPVRFPGASVEVVEVLLRVGASPATLPWGVEPAELLGLPSVPLDPSLRSGDAELWGRVCGCSVPLGDLCEVDTGLVAHSTAGGKELLLSDEPGPGRVPFADARQFFAGERRYLRYGEGVRMHRAKRPELFEGPKVVVQRLRGGGPVRAEVDHSGAYVAHTCVVARPLDGRVPLRRLAWLIRSPLLDGLLRVAHGRRLDLYPRVLRQVPVPRAWLLEPELPLDRAWSLEPAAVARLRVLAAPSRVAH